MGLIVGQNIVLRFVLLSQGKREIVFKVAFGLHLQYTNSKNVLFVIYEKKFLFLSIFLPTIFLLFVSECIILAVR